MTDFFALCGPIDKGFFFFLVELLNLMSRRNNKDEYALDIDNYVHHQFVITGNACYLIVVQGRTVITSYVILPSEEPVLLVFKLSKSNSAELFV